MKSDHGRWSFSKVLLDSPTFMMQFLKESIYRTFGPMTIQNMILSVTYYLELRNDIIVYYAFHFLPTMVELVVWTI